MFALGDVSAPARMRSAVAEDVLCGALSCTRPSTAGRDRLGGRRWRRGRRAGCGAGARRRQTRAHGTRLTQARQRHRRPRSGAYRRACRARRGNRPGARSGRARFRVLRLGVGRDGRGQRASARACSSSGGPSRSRAGSERAEEPASASSTSTRSTTSRPRANASSRRSAGFASAGRTVWRAERRVHYGSAELRAGQFELGERLVEEGCETLAQTGARRARGRRRSASARSWTPTEEGRAGRVTTLRPLIAQAESRRACLVGGAVSLGARLGRVRGRQPSGRRSGADADARSESPR